jgi:CubicO group peptidase (beta-lactamase class C family)
MITVSAEQIGLSAARLELAYGLLEKTVQRGGIRAAVLAVGRQGQLSEPRCFGRRGPDQGAAPTTTDSVFLMASIPKPVTATATICLVDDGLLALDQRVVEFIPEFGVRGKEPVAIWHLLTHTSGLPDMLPQNERLRAEHAGLERFVEGACQSDLLFPPGTAVSYQSSGFAILGEIVERLTHMKLRAFLQERLFAPLQMTSTALGLRDDLRPSLVEVDLPPEKQTGDWHWNSEYWRNLGVPWGGMFSTAPDVARFLQMFLAHGRAENQMVLHPSTAAAMTSDQLASKPHLLPSATYSSWGLGWQLRSPLFGRLASEGTFGHGGATGTIAWADPVRDLVCALLTNQPLLWQEQSELIPQLSDLVVSACM